MHRFKLFHHCLYVVLTKCEEKPLNMNTFLRHCTQILSSYHNNKKKKTWMLLLGVTILKCHQNKIISSCTSFITNMMFCQVLSKKKRKTCSITYLHKGAVLWECAWAPSSLLHLEGLQWRRKSVKRGKNPVRVWGLSPAYLCPASLHICSGTWDTITTFTANMNTTYRVQLPFKHYESDKAHKNSYG